MQYTTYAHTFGQIAAAVVNKGKSFRVDFDGREEGHEVLLAIPHGSNQWGPTEEYISFDKDLRLRDSAQHVWDVLRTIRS